MIKCAPKTWWTDRQLSGLFIIAYVLCSGSGIVGVSIGLNALSTHAACTVWWAFLATMVVSATASVRKFHQIGWLTWAGFISIFAAVLIVVIAVTTRDRPAAAPATGEYDLGFYAVAYPSFAAGMVATCTIFVSSAGTSAFLPVISEMKNPRDFRKALFLCMSLVTAAYLAFSLVVYRWCGQWVASPSLGSAGQVRCLNVLPQSRYCVCGMMLILKKDCENGCLRRRSSRPDSVSLSVPSRSGKVLLRAGPTSDSAFAGKHRYPLGDLAWPDIRPRSFIFCSGHGNSDFPVLNSADWKYLFCTSRNLPARLAVDLRS